MAAARRRWLSLLVHPRDLVGSATKRDAVERALRSGALDLVQLRSTESDSKEQVAAAGKILAELVYEQVHSFPHANVTQFVVNHASLELALGIGAGGWHLKERILMESPQNELQEGIRLAKTNNVTIGCSVHSVEAALFAAKCGVDYIQVGTMFSTLSHPDKLQLEGPELLRSIRRAWKDVSAQDPLAIACPPLIAVGGINTEQHVSRVISEGADGVAVIRGILADEHPENAARSFREWLDQ